MKSAWFRISLHIFVLGGLTVFLYGFVLAPQKKAVNGFNMKVRAQVQEIEESLSVLEEIVGEGGEVAHLREEVRQLRSHFIAGDNLPAFTMQLVEWARQAGFEPTRFIPPIDGEGKGQEIASRNGISIVELPVILETEGSFLAYGRFLESLREFPYYITPGRVWMESRAEGTLPLTIGTEFFVFVIEERDANGVRHGS